MADLLGKWCLITGAASGIGKAAAEVLQAEGARLILCDINQDHVDQLGEALRRAGAEVLTYAVDVALRPPMERFADWVHDQVGVVDVLINNAGILRTGGFDDSTFEDWHEVFDVNFWGVLHATKLFVPPMVERGAGAVVNVASASGLVGFSRLSAYSTSKHAVIGLSESLRGELSDAGVTVSAVCPGLVRTEIAKNSGLPEAEKDAIEDLLARKGIAPEQVALAIVRAAARGTPLVTVGSDAKAIHAAQRLFPGSASKWLAAISSRDSR